MYTSAIGNVIIFKNCYIFVARRGGRRAGCRALHVALDVLLVVAQVCGQFRVSRNRARVSVSCI